MKAYSWDYGVLYWNEYTFYFEQTIGDVSLTLLCVHSIDDKFDVANISTHIN